MALGGFVNLSVSDKFKIQSELLYQGMGGSFDGETFKSEYVNIPVLAQYAVTENFRIEAGPQFGILVSSKSAGEDIKDNFIIKQNIMIELFPNTPFNEHIYDIQRI
jgi:hypothetical protein